MLCNNAHRKTWRGMHIRTISAGLEDIVLMHSQPRTGEYNPLWERMSRQAAWNPCQIATQNVNRECCKHEDGSYPEAPVAMHPSPVRTRIRLTPIAAISFLIVLASGHLFSSQDSKSLEQLTSRLFPLSARASEEYNRLLRQNSFAMNGVGTVFRSGNNVFGFGHFVLRAMDDQQKLV